MPMLISDAQNTLLAYYDSDLPLSQAFLASGSPAFKTMAAVLLTQRLVAAPFILYKYSAW